MPSKTDFFIIILSLFCLSSITTLPMQYTKSSDYYVACCPENCCPPICYCACSSCDKKPCFSWDNDKFRFALCIYTVLEASGRENEKRSCACSFQKSHINCIDCGADFRNCIGQTYDTIRKCRCIGPVTNSSCDCCGCCIRRQ